MYFFLSKFIYLSLTERGHDKAGQTAGGLAHLPVPGQGAGGRHGYPDQTDQLLLISPVIPGNLAFILQKKLCPGS